MPFNYFNCIETCPSGFYPSKAGACVQDSKSNIGYNITLDYTTFNKTREAEPYPHFDRGRFFDGESYLVVNWLLNPEFTISLWLYSYTQEPKPVFSAQTKTSPFTVLSAEGKLQWQNIIVSCYSILADKTSSSHCMRASSLSRYRKEFSAAPMLEFSSQGEAYLGKDHSTIPQFFKGFIYEAQLINRSLEALMNFFSTTCSGGCKFCPKSGKCPSTCTELQVFDRNKCRECDMSCPFCTESEPCTYCKDNRMEYNCRYFGLFESEDSIKDCGVGMLDKNSKKCKVRSRAECCLADEASLSPFCKVHFNLDDLCVITASDVEGAYSNNYNRFNFTLTFNNTELSSNCSSIFEDDSMKKLGDNPICSWLNPQNLEITLGYDAMSDEGNVTFAITSLKMRGGRTPKEPLVIQVLHTTSLPSPSIVWEMPPYYNTCKNLTFSAEKSSGFANRAYNAVWKLNGRNLGTQALKIKLSTEEIGGELEISLNVTNKFGQSDYKVVKIPETKHTFWIKPQNPRSVYKAASSIFIETSTIILCDETPAGMQYVWLDGKNNSIGNSSNLSLKPLFFKPETAQNIEVKLMQGVKIRAESKLSFNLQPSPLVMSPNYKGNVVISKNANTKIDPKIRDPDDPDFKDFIVTWNCTWMETGQPCPPRKKNFRGLNSGQVYPITQDSFNPFYNYNLTAVISNGKKTTKLETLMYYSALKVPGLSIQDPGLVNPRKPLIIATVVDPVPNLDDEYKYQWTQLTHFKAGYSTSLKQQTLGFEPDSLEPNKVYTLSVTVTNTVADSTVSVSFPVNHWPIDCAFTISPTSGIELVDYFQFEVSSCTDPEEHYPLKYQYFTKMPDGSLESITPVISVSYWTQFMGRSKGNLIEVVARIYDSEDCYDDRQAYITLNPNKDPVGKASSLVSSTLEGLRNSTVTYRDAISNLAGSVMSTFYNETYMDYSKISEDCMTALQEIIQLDIDYRDEDLTSIADIMNIATSSTSSLKEWIVTQSLNLTLTILRSLDDANKLTSATLLEVHSNLLDYSVGTCLNYCKIVSQIYDANMEVAFDSLKNNTINQVPVIYETDEFTIKPSRILGTESNNTFTIDSTTSTSPQKVNFNGALCSTCDNQILDIVLMSTQGMLDFNTSNVTALSNALTVSARSVGVLLLSGEVEQELQPIVGKLNSSVSINLPLGEFSLLKGKPSCSNFNLTSGQFEMNDHCREVSFNLTYLTCSCDYLPVTVQASLDLWDPEPYFVEWPPKATDEPAEESISYWIVGGLFNLWVGLLTAVCVVKDSAWRIKWNYRGEIVRKAILTLARLYNDRHSQRIETETLSKDFVIKQLSKCSEEPKIISWSFKRKIIQFVGRGGGFELFKTLDASDRPLDDYIVSQHMNFTPANSTNKRSNSQNPTQLSSNDRLPIMNNLLIQSRLWNFWTNNESYSPNSLRFNYVVSLLLFIIYTDANNLAFNKDVSVEQINLSFTFYGLIWGSAALVALIAVSSCIERMNEQWIFVKSRKLQIRLYSVQMAITSLLNLGMLHSVYSKLSDFNASEVRSWLVNSSISVFIVCFVLDFVITYFLTLNLIGLIKVLSRCCRSKSKVQPKSG